MLLAAPAHMQIRAFFAVSAAFLASALDSAAAIRNLHTYAPGRPMPGQEAFTREIPGLAELFAVDASDLERRPNISRSAGDHELSPKRDHERSHVRTPWMRQTRWAEAIGSAIHFQWVIDYMRNPTESSEEAANEAQTKRKVAKAKHAKTAKNAKTAKKVKTAKHAKTAKNAKTAKKVKTAKHAKSAKQVKQATSVAPTASLAAQSAEHRTSLQRSSRSWDGSDAFYWVLFFCMFALFFVTQYRSLQTAREYRYGFLLRFFMYLGLALVFGIIVDAENGTDDGISWASGYMIELTFSLENILLFHSIIEEFQVPPRNTSKALFIVMQARIAFQAWIFLGLADTVERMHWVPFVLGSVLIYMGISSLLGHGASEHALREDYRNSIVTRVFKWAFGDRFVLHYDMHLSIFVRGRDDRCYITLLAPVILTLLAVDMCFEIDVTLLKIEDCDDHFVAFTSSALAAFAVPEMYNIVRILFEQFYLLKHALGVIIIFFGVDLLCEQWFQISDIAAICILSGIIISSMLVSWIFNLGPGDKIVEKEESADFSLPNSDGYSEVENSDGRDGGWEAIQGPLRRLLRG